MSRKSNKAVFSYIQNHKCKLNQLQLGGELPSYPPYAPLYAKHLYAFTKTWMTVSEFHPLSKTYFRSEAAIFQERRRQLDDANYRIIIHPFSGLAIVLKVTGVFLWKVAFFLDPLIGAFGSNFIDEDRNTDPQDMFQFVLNVFFLIHSISNFFLGFEKSRTKEIVLDQTRIAKRYLCTFFVFDFAPIVYQAVYHFSSESSHAAISSIPLYTLRFVRLPTMLFHLLEITSYYQVPESVAKCIVLSIFQLTVLHWWTCIFFLVPSVGYYYKSPSLDSWVIKSAVGTNRTLLNLYLETAMSIACHYVGAGTGNIKTDYPPEQLILAMTIICGLTVHIYMIAIILLIFGTINISESKYEEMMVQLNDYMLAKRISPTLKQRLNIYYKYRFQKQFFNEDTILSGLSEHLRCEVLLYSCKNLIQRMRLLRDASKEVIGAIVSLLKQEIFLPDDYILKEDSYNEHVYFVSYGTVAIYVTAGNEAGHIEDGQHFGEIGMVLNENRNFAASAIAIEVTEVFYLEKKDFAYIASLDPDLAMRIQQSARDKMQRYEIGAQESCMKVDSSDILAELRRGNILEKKRKRH